MKSIIHGVVDVVSHLGHSRCLQSAVAVQLGRRSVSGVIVRAAGQAVIGWCP